MMTGGDSCQADASRSNSQPSSLFQTVAVV